MKLYDMLVLAEYTEKGIVPYLRVDYEEVYAVHLWRDYIPIMSMGGNNYNRLRLFSQ